MAGTNMYSRWCLNPRAFRVENYAVNLTDSNKSNLPPYLPAVGANEYGYSISFMNNSHQVQWFHFASPMQSAVAVTHPAWRDSGG